MQHDFDTPRPITLVLEGPSVDVAIATHDDPTTRIGLTDPQDTQDAPTVTQEGDVVRVIYPNRPRREFFRSHQHLEAVVDLPRGSSLHLALGSGDLSARGEYDQILVDGGSGDLAIDDCARLVTRGGSGDLSVRAIQKEAEIRQGSGDLVVAEITGSASVWSGSGDVQLDRLHDADLDVMTGSGEVALGEVRGGTTTLKTGSGDVVVRRVHHGELKATTASGDVAVSVQQGLPVWTEVLTASGDISSTLRGAGRPAEGEPYLALTVRTASGDIDLTEA